MSVLTMWRRAVVSGLAAGLAVGAVAAAVAAEIFPPAGLTQPALRSGVVAVRVRVPRGILPDVPSGGDPNFRYHPLAYAAPPVVFVPPVIVAPPIYDLVPPVVFAPPIYELVPPIDAFVPFDFWPCFVPTEHTGQFGHYGSCAESYFRQFTNRPD